MECNGVTEDNFRVQDLRSWKTGIAVNLDRNHCRRNRFGREQLKFHLDMLFDMIIKHSNEDVREVVRCLILQFETRAINLGFNNMQVKEAIAKKRGQVWVLSLGTPYCLEIGGVKEQTQPEIEKNQESIVSWKPSK